MIYRLKLTGNAWDIKDSEKLLYSVQVLISRCDPCLNSISIKTLSHLFFIITEENTNQLNLNLNLIEEED